MKRGHSKRSAKTSRIIFLLLAFGNCLHSQSISDFKKACFAIADLYSKKQTDQLNDYIDPQTGIYFITKPGASAVFTLERTITPKTTPAFFYPDKISPSPADKELYFKKNLRFDCEKESWGSKGTLADSSGTYRPVSSIIKFRKDAGENFSDAQIGEQAAREKKYRKVVFTELRNGSGLVIYLFNTKGKWFIAVIDLAETDCGA